MNAGPDSTLTQVVSQKLDLIASKLGVAAAHLWAALIRQQYIDGWTNVLVAVLAVTGIVGAWKGARYLFAQTKRESHGYLDDNMGQWIGIAFLSLAVVALTIIVAGSIHAAITCFANPEYGAFSQLAKML